MLSSVPHKMAWPSMLLLLVLVSLAGCMHFDLSEFDVNYDLQLVITPESKPAAGFSVQSKHGGSFACQVPLAAPASSPSSDNDETLLNQAFPKGSCVRLTKGWWTYEVCSQLNVTQYHLEKQKGRQQVTLLGDYDALASSSPMQQRYLNGSYCELKDSNRSSSIRFVCDEKATLPALTAVAEPLTCIYTMQIATKAACHEPTRPTLLPCWQATPRQPPPVSLLQPTHLFRGTYDCRGRHEVSMLVQYSSSLHRDGYKFALQCLRPLRLVQAVLWVRKDNHDGVYRMHGTVGSAGVSTSQPIGMGSRGLCV